MGLVTNLKVNMKKNFSAGSIRNRLFKLLLRAFAIVVFITLSIVIIGASLAVTFSSNDIIFERIPSINRLETYYLSMGQWDNVTSVFQYLDKGEQKIWLNMSLLNEKQQIIVSNGQAVEPPEEYIKTENELIIPIIINDETVGSVVLPPGFMATRLFFVFSGLLPVFLISIFLAILTTLIGLLLTRSVVNPLAEVIAAAQAVANGRLESRVNPKGPDDIRILSDSFNHMAASLERNDQERRDLLADIAHELRTPLTVLHGRLEGILDGIYQPDEEHIVSALESTYLLERLVEDLRLLTLAESRQLQFDPKDTNLYKICERSIELFSAQALEKKISLTIQTSNNELTAWLDPQRFEQVIGNLINNSLQFTPENGKVLITIQPEDEYILIKVNDNGPGISEEDLPYIFNRFWRKEKSRSRKNGGTGLGLAISKQLIEAQGGLIWAETNEEGGLSVAIRIHQLK